MSINISNSATITYNGESVTPTCPVITTIEPKLGVYKSAVTDKGTFTDENPTNEVGDGNQIRYQLQLINYSSVDFTNVVINDEIELPAGVNASQLTFLAPPQSSYNNEETLPKIKFTIANIPKESALNVFYTIKLDETIPNGSTFKNKAIVEYDQNPSKTPGYSNAVSVTYNATFTEVIASKSGPDDVFCDEKFDYVLAFENKGKKVASDVIITDLLPTEFVVDEIVIVNDEIILDNNVDYSYVIDPVTNVLTIESINDGLDIQPQTALVVTITGSVPCIE